jgi:hypothetical protein
MSLISVVYVVRYRSVRRAEVSTRCGVSECYHAAATMRGPWPTRGCRTMKTKKIDT